MIQEIFLGLGNYSLVNIPQMVWSCVNEVDDEISLVANCAGIPRDPKKIEQETPFDPLITNV